MHLLNPEAFLHIISFNLFGISGSLNYDTHITDKKTEVLGDRVTCPKVSETKLLANHSRFIGLISTTILVLSSMRIRALFLKLLYIF